MQISPHHQSFYSHTQTYLHYRDSFVHFLEQSNQFGTKPLSALTFYTATTVAWRVIYVFEHLLVRLFAINIGVRVIRGREGR